MFLTIHVINDFGSYPGLLQRLAVELLHLDLVVEDVFGEERFFIEGGREGYKEKLLDGKMSLEEE